MALVAAGARVLDFGGSLQFQGGVLPGLADSCLGLQHVPGHSRCVCLVVLGFCVVPGRLGLIKMGGRVSGPGPKDIGCLVLTVWRGSGWSCLEFRFWESGFYCFGLAASSLGHWGVE